MNRKSDHYLDHLLLSDQEEGDNDIIPIISDGDDEDIEKTEVPEVIPIIPLRNMVLFPGVIIPISVGRDKSLAAIREVYKGDRLIGAVSQKDATVEEPRFEDMNAVGTVGHILKLLEMPDGTTTAIIQGRKRMAVMEWVSDQPYFMAKVQALQEVKPEEGLKEFEAIVGSLKDLSLRIIKLSPNLNQEAAFALKNIENSNFLINYICTNSDLKPEEKQKLLETTRIRDRGIQLMEYLVREVQVLELKMDIQTKVKSDLDQQQREFLLHQQMKTIQDELGGSPVEKEIEEFRKRAKKKKWSKAVEETFYKELDKLQRLNPAAAEYSVQINYIQTLLDLPWNDFSEDNLDLEHARKVLEEDHYGLEKVKERIMEHLAVLKLKGDLKSPILCLHGPPGVGKTSLGKSVARALGRKYVRMSLGGLHDEAEIRGHRKTYIGALPGRIIQSIRKAGTSNPVFILDEVDKVGQDFRGDPASALLEVLDPEQNLAFYDNFLEMEYDLSKVMFIATANVLTTIQPALRDRMELIEISGYIVEEKKQIARRHLIPKQLENHGVKKGQLKFPDKILEQLVQNYTRESGVRELDKSLAKIVRQTALQIAGEKDYDPKLDAIRLREIMGVPKYQRDAYSGNDQAGVVTGLAWTSAGGEILFVETSLSKGTGKLTLTGNLGDVMKESAVIALEYLKAHAGILGLPADFAEKWNVHIHIPEGAIPKDGPSAGVTMATSIASAFTQRKVKKYLAMTGEITLRGKVLPVGGIKEKILAAKRANLKEILLSAENRKDIEEIKEIYLRGLKFHYVDTLMDVLEYALLQQKVRNPRQIIKS